jgi:hypothetical protein
MGGDGTGRVESFSVIASVEGPDGYLSTGWEIQFWTFKDFPLIGFS